MKDAPADGKPRRRVLALAFAYVGVPVLTLAAAELGVRICAPAASGGADVEVVSPLSIFAETTVDGARYYQVTHPQAYGERRVRFPVKKPDGAMRVFSLGGSASAGWPHPPREIYSAHLERALRAAYAGRPVEVLNVGAHGFASYRVRHVFEDVLDFEPDLLILWSGNNEFFERRAYLGESALGRLAGSSQLLRRLRAWARPESRLSGEGRTRAATRDFLLSLVDRAPHELRSDPAQFEGVHAHYAESIGSMLESAGARGVPVVLLTVPVNLKDWHPNVSFVELEGPERARWQDLLDRARRLALEDRPAEAAALYEDALALAPLHAESQFGLGRALEAQGRYAEARAAYVSAIDLDYAPWRALSAFNAILREFAARDPHVHLVDLEAVFQKAAPNGLPGFDLFLDYVHPTRAGNLLVSRAVFDAIAGGALLGPPSTRRFRPGALPPRGPDPDLRLRGRLLWFFLAMHQYEAIVDVTTALLVTDLPDAERRRLEDLRGHALAFLDSRRRELLGEPYDDTYRERHAAFMREAFQDVYDPARATDESLDH